MEIDTGSTLSVINTATFEELRHGKEQLSLCSTDILLRAFSGDKIKPEGICEVSVKDLDGKYTRLLLIIVKGNQPSLLGRDWTGGK